MDRDTGKNPRMNPRDELKGYSMERRRDLVRFAALQLRDWEMAEDVVQEALLAAERNIGQFEGDASLKTWLFSILRNKIVDVLRSRRRETPISQMGRLEGDEGRANDLFDQRGFWATEHKPHRWANPDESLEQQEFWRIFELCLEGLPERTAQVFAMRELLGLETEEICKELSISASNCWVILHRARAGLRECLEERWFAQQR